MSSRGKIVERWHTWLRKRLASRGKRRLWEALAALFPFEKALKVDLAHSTKDGAKVRLTIVRADAPSVPVWEFPLLSLTWRKQKSVVINLDAECEDADAEDTSEEGSEESRPS